MRPDPARWPNATMHCDVWAEADLPVWEPSGTLWTNYA
jgi:hypothetical protein